MSDSSTSVGAALARGAIAAALLAVLFAPFARAAGLPGSGGARIDGVLLPPERIWDEYRYQYCSRAMIHSLDADAVDEKLLGAVIEQVVGSELISREAARRGYTLSDRERESLRAAELERWRGETNFKTACRLLKVGEPFMLARAARQRVVETMAAGESRSEEGLTDKVLEEYYRTHLGDYLPVEMPPVRYIFVPAGPGVTRAMLDDISNEAFALGKDGKSFLPLVERYSKHPSAAAGGVVSAGVSGLPFQPPPGKPKECRHFGEFDAAGIHLYLRDCRQPRPLAEVREKVRIGLVFERRRAWVRELAEGLRKKAKIEYLATDTPPAPPAPPAAAVAPAAGKAQH